MTTEDIFRTITQKIAEVEPEFEDFFLRPEDSMKQLGVSSVSRVEILMLTMEELGIVLPNSELAAARNLGDLVHLFARSLNA